MELCKILLGKTKDDILYLNPELKEEDLDYILEFVYNIFNKNPKVARYWFFAQNPNFGGASPRLLLLKSRGHRILQFIKSLDTNKA